MEWQTKQIRRTYNRLGLGMLAYLLIYQFLSLPLMLLVKLLCPQLLSSSWFGLLLGELVQYAIALPVCWWIAKSANTPQRPLSRRKLSVSCFFKYLLLSIGLLFLFNLIGTAVNELLSQLKGSPAGNLVEQSVGSYTLWQMVLVTVISAPLGEELLFRKLVYRCVGAYGDKAYVFTSACLFSYTLWQMVLVTVISAPLGEELLFRKLVYRCVGAYGDKAYVFTSACLFMLMHGNVVQYPYAFALGGLFAWIYCKTGSLRNTILLHACVNFIGGVIPYLAGESELVLSLLGMLYLLGAAYVGYTLWRCRGRHPLQNDPKLPEGALDAALLNVGMLLFTAASFAMAGYVILYL